MPNQTVIHELQTLGTATVSDALDCLGINGGCIGLQTVVPGLRCAGSAFTVCFSRTGEGPALAANYMNDVPSGSVVVLDNLGRRDCTVWGSLLTEVAKKRGVSGTVINGVCRDTEAIRTAAYPVFSLGRYMKSGKGRTHMASTGMPIQLDGVTIHPGDLILADDDGVLVIPQLLCNSVLDVARQVERCEQLILADICAGIPLAEARDRHRYNQFSLAAGMNRNETNDNPVEQKLRRLLADVMPRAEATLHLPATTNLRELGLDSFGLMQLLSELDHSFDITLDEDDLQDSHFESIATITAFIINKQS